MSWLKLDDAFDSHPKVQELSDAEAWRWVRVLLYCARHETDGAISGAVLTRLGVSTKTRALLLELGLLDPNGEGFRVHDFLAFNPSKADAALRREAQRRGGKMGAERRWGDRSTYRSTHGSNLEGYLGDSHAPVPVPIKDALHKPRRRALSTDEREVGGMRADDTGVLAAARAPGARDVGAVLPELGGDGGYGWS